MAERRESVRLELQDSGFSTGMVKNAAATGLLEKALKSLDGTTVNVHQSLAESATGVDNLDRSARNADGSINQLTGRLRVLGEVAAILAPTLAPLGGVAIAGVAGLANQIGLAAIASGVLIGSLQGVGDALGAMNKAQLEPTAKNLEKARDALKALSPEARKFSEQLFNLKPALAAIRDIGAESLIPGLSDAFDRLERLGPKVAGIFDALGGALGDIAFDSASSLASERWADFFELIRTEGPSTITELATTVGDLTHGLSELWEAFAPLNSDFSSWLMGVADGFDQWATGLSATQGFSEFVDYIQTTGPQLAETLGAIANAVIQIVQATAPLATPVLAGLEAAANAIGAIADSDLGTPIFAGIAALSLLNRTLAVTASLSKVSLSSGIFAGLGTVSTGAKKGAGSLRSLSDDVGVLSRNLFTAGTASERMAAQNKKAFDGIKGSARAVAPAAGVIGGLALASTGAADAIGLTNTTSLALMGTMAGPWGAAVGGGVGLLLDWKASSDEAAASADNFRLSLQSMDASALTETLERLNGLQAATGDDFLGADLISARIRDTESALKGLEWQEKKTAIEAKGAALEFLQQTGANVDLAKWSGKSAEQIKAQAAAIGEAQDSANATAASFVTLGESLNDGKKSLTEWIKEMADSADALRNFTANSKRAAKNGLNDGLIESLQQAGEEGARRMRQLANASDTEIAKANRAWRKGQQAIKEYNDYKVPPKKVTADVSRALQSFREVDTYLSNLNGKRAITYVDTVRTVTGPQGAAVTGQRADGGSIPKDGGPYSDRFLYMLAPGEEVISNRHGQADAFRADRASGRIPGYADGGTTGKRPEKDKRKPMWSPFVEDRSAALEQAIRILTAKVEDQTAITERDIAARDFWSEKMSQAGQNTLSNFGLDLWSKSSSPWAAGAGGGALFNLNKTNAGLTDRIGIQEQLAGLGLSGDALGQLLTGTNADISGMIQRGEIGAYAQAFSQYQSLSGIASSTAGQQAYGREYAQAAAAAQASAIAQHETNVHLAGVQATLDSHTALLASVGDRAGSAAATGFAQSGNRAARRRRRDR